MEYATDQEVVRMAGTIALAGSNIEAFMKRLRDIPLLDTATEQLLATMIQEGISLSNRMQDQPLTECQRRVIEAGLAARTNLVFHNLRFAAWAARWSMGWQQVSQAEFIREVVEQKPRGKAKIGQIPPLRELARFPMPLEDRIQEAVLALLEAANKFQPAANAKFITYATWRINQRLRRQVPHDFLREAVSDHIAPLVLQVRAAQRKLRRLTGQEPSPEMILSDIAPENKDSHYGVKAISYRLEEISQMPSHSLEEIDEMLAAYDSATGELLCLADILADGDLPEVHGLSMFNALGNALEDVLDTLSEREAGTISMRFGVSDGLPKTLDEVGRVYGVTRERIRQIEDKTMSKLRHPHRSRALRAYLEPAGRPRKRQEPRYVITRENRPDLYGLPPQEAPKPSEAEQEPEPAPSPKSETSA